MPRAAALTGSGVAGSQVRLARVLGGLSIVSGAALLLAPDAAAALYGLPSQRALVRALGVRDIGVGLLLRSPKGAVRGCRLRSLSDAFDLGLIAATEGRSPSSTSAAVLRLTGAVALIGLSREVLARLTRQAGRAPAQVAGLLG